MKRFLKNDLPPLLMACVIFSSAFLIGLACYTKNENILGADQAQGQGNGASPSPSASPACSLPTVAVRIDPSGPTALTLGGIGDYTAVREIQGPADAPSGCQGKFIWAEDPKDWAQILGDATQPKISVKCLVAGHNSLIATAEDNQSASASYGITCQ